MGLIFSNLAGLWALLGIPAILLIHFFQKERREVVTSTLFLLENMQRESKSGARFERLRHSLPLWLQILAVLLLTWILTEPRWIRPDSFQRVVVVLDSSASMSAFREEAIASLDQRLDRLSRTTARQEWIVLETDPRRETLYSGDDDAALLQALGNWRPRVGTHSPLPVLKEARALLRETGTVLFVTDREREDLPAGVHLLAAGSPIENCGFTGLRLEKREDGLIWHTLVRNHGHSPQTREWQATFDGRATPPRTIRLEPGQTVSLSGRFPDGTAEGFLSLTADPFALDDWLPLVRPEPKPLALFVETHPLLDDFAPPFLRSLPDWHPPARGAADLRLATRLPSQTHPSQPGIYFLAEPEEPKQLLTAPVVAENHPLLRELNWQGLLIQSDTAPAIEENDRVLLWQGERPLIVLREVAGKRWLFCNFDLRYANAGRLPAFVVLLHRFLDQVRAGKIGFEQRNLQTHQNFPIAADPLGADLSIAFTNRAGESTETTIEPFRAPAFLTPDEPGFLKIKQGETPLLKAAVHFADAREADFRAAASADDGPDAEAAILEQNSTADFLTPLWLVLLGGLFVSTWWLTGRRER